jgi:hypothetical protein
MPKETPKDQVLLMDSIAVMSVGTWVKFEKLGGSLRVRTEKIKKVPLSHAEGGPTGTRTKSMFCCSRNCVFKEIILFARNSGLKGCKFCRLLENSFQE